MANDAQKHCTGSNRSRRTRILKDEWIFGNRRLEQNEGAESRVFGTALPIKQLIEADDVEHARSHLMETVSKSSRPAAKVLDMMPTGDSDELPKSTAAEYLVSRILAAHAIGTGGMGSNYLKQSAHLKAMTEVDENDFIELRQMMLNYLSKSWPTGTLNDEGVPMDYAAVITKLGQTVFRLRKNGSSSSVHPPANVSRDLPLHKLTDGRNPRWLESTSLNSKYSKHGSFLEKYTMAIPGEEESDRPSSSDSQLFYVNGSNGSNIVDQHLRNKGWKRTNNPDGKFKLKWVESKLRIRYNCFLEGEQMVNHLPSSWCLSNKIRLVVILRELDAHQRPGLMRMCDIMPETFRLDMAPEQAEFRTRYKSGEIWICKPAALNQGKGIFLVRCLADFDKRYTNTKTPPHAPLRVIQRYISNPLLLNGRKMDIRGFMLVASTAPFLVLFHPGYVRVSCGQYNTMSDDMCTHLTNQFMQKKDPRYSIMKEDTIWSMEQLNGYINEQLASKGIEPNWVFQVLMIRMRRIMLHCFLAAKSRLESKMGYFELLGFDFIVDTDLKVWLIEINVNPSMCTNCAVLRALVPALIEETLDISVECFEKNRRHLPLLPLQYMRGFALLYCGERTSSWPLNYSPKLNKHQIVRNKNDSQTD